MNKLITARKKLAQLLGEKETILSLLVDDGRAATDEERSKLDSIETQRKVYQEVIDELDKLVKERAAADVSSDTPAARGTTPAPRIQVTREEGEDEEGCYNPFRSMGEYMQAVVRADRDPRNVDERLLNLNKRAASGSNEASGQDGGFLVQPSFSSELIQKTFDAGVLASKCRIITLSNSNSMSFPTVEDYSRADGSRWGGVQVYWENEADTPTATKPKFGTLDMKLKKLMGLFYATEEVLADAGALGSYINGAFPDEFAFKLDDAIFRGSGTGQPLGIMNSNALITVTAVTGQGAATFIGQNAVDMRTRLWARSRGNAEWFANQDTEGQLCTLTITKSKSDIPLYTPANGLNVMKDRVLNMDVNVIEQSETLGTKGDVALFDMSQYLLLKREGIAAAESIHVKFTTEERAFRWSMRVDGQPLWKKDLTPYKGTNTVSPFVVLATSRT